MRVTAGLGGNDRDPQQKEEQMRKYVGALAALGAALSFATLVPIADARSGGGGGHGASARGGGGHGHASSGRSSGHVAGNFRGRGRAGGHGHGGHWRGRGIGYGAGIFLGDAYDDYDSCYYRRGRRICRY
jgi:hypothetical protein